MKNPFRRRAHATPVMFNWELVAMRYEDDEGHLHYYADILDVSMCLDRLADSMEMRSGCLGPEQVRIMANLLNDWYLQKVVQA